MHQHSIGVHVLEEFCCTALTKAGMRDEDATIVSRVIVGCDVRGVDTHGIVALPGYIQQIRAGGVRARPNMEIVSESASTAVVDADAGLGQLSGVFGMRLSMKKASSTGQGTVVVRNSNHFGSAGSFAVIAADEGMIGEVYSNSRPCMTISGAVGRVIGNNPFAFAAPAGKYPPIVHDIAMSTVAYGKVRVAQDSGTPIPIGWIIDRLGDDTTDPHQWEHGASLIPMGGHKGYGLALAGEIMTSIIGGGRITNQVGSWRREPARPTNVSLTFRATNIEAFMPIDEFCERMDTLIYQMHQAPKAPGVERIVVPGEIENERAKSATTRGILLSESTVVALNKLASDLAIESSIIP